jgi:hypothetical protein
MIAAVSSEPLCLINYVRIVVLDFENIEEGV